MRYFYNDLHEIAVRVDGNNTFVKTKGDKEVKDTRDSEGRSSKAVTDAFIENMSTNGKTDITKAEYEAF